jgi:hypothetical protein
VFVCQQARQSPANTDVTVIIDDIAEYVAGGGFVYFESQ